MMLNNFWIGTILLPLFAVLLKSEITNLYKSWTIFRSNSFDEDRDPTTPDRCQIYDPAKGQWNDVLIVRIAFSLNRNKRGVFLYHPVDGKFGASKDWAAEQISLLTWADLRKRKRPQPLESNLEKMIASKFPEIPPT